MITFEIKIQSRKDRVKHKISCRNCGETETTVVYGLWDSEDGWLAGKYCRKCMLENSMYGELKKDNNIFKEKSSS